MYLHVINPPSPMNVLLVRNPSEDTPDRYHQHLVSIGLHPYSVPVLETIYTNLGDLRRIVEGESLGYGGVIMTSSRSAECWNLIKEDLSSTGRDGLTSRGEQFHARSYGQDVSSETGQRRLVKCPVLRRGYNDRKCPQEDAAVSFFPFLPKYRRRGVWYGRSAGEGDHRRPRRPYCEAPVALSDWRQEQRHLADTRSSGGARPRTAPGLRHTRLSEFLSGSEGTLSAPPTSR